MTERAITTGASGVLAGKNIKMDALLIALFVAIMTACAWIKVPGPVPVTLQTFGVFLTVGLLGTKRGTIAIGSYLALGLLGAPVFAGFAGGLPYLLGVTGGYIIGFLFSALATGKIIDRLGKGAPALVLAMVVGLVVCYAFGTAWFMIVSGTAFTGEGVGYVLSLCVTPFIIPDAIKIALAVCIVKAVGMASKMKAN